MSDPNLPEGVTQKDIDATCGETFDPNNPYDRKELLQHRLKNIKELCGYMNGFHPPVCKGWNVFNQKIFFRDLLRWGWLIRVRNSGIIQTKKGHLPCETEVAL